MEQVGYAWEGGSTVQVELGWAEDGVPDCIAPWQTFWKEKRQILLQDDGSTSTVGINTTSLVYALGGRRMRKMSREALMTTKMKATTLTRILRTERWSFLCTRRTFGGRKALTKYFVEILCNMKVHSLNSPFLF